MVDLAKLDELIARVEKAAGPDRQIDFDFASMEGWTLQKMKGDRQPYWRKPGETAYYMRSEPPRYTASIDEALGLVERLLPGKLLRLSNEYQGFWRATVGLTEGTGMRTAALAIILALLEALREASHDH